MDRTSINGATMHPETQAPPVAILRTDEAARYVGLPRRTFQTLRANGELPPHVKLGVRANGWRICDLDAWLASRIVKETAR